MVMEVKWKQREHQKVCLEDIAVGEWFMLHNSQAAIYMKTNECGGSWAEIACVDKSGRITEITAESEVKPLEATLEIDYKITESGCE